MIDALKTAAKRYVIERLQRADAARRASLPVEFNGLPPSLWGWTIDAGDRLALEGVAAVDLARDFGTPLYVVSVPWLRYTHDAFLGPFRSRLPGAQLATSYKTNPVPFVLESLHGFGTHAEVISEFELWLAQRLGLPGERIIVNGPGKTQAMIERAVHGAVRIVNVDGLGEVERIAGVAERVGRRQAVGVRVVTSVGWSSQFGLPIADGQAFAAFEAIARAGALVPQGIHLHLGTGIKSVATYLQAVREVLEFARHVESRLGVRIDWFDLGGGFGVPTVRGTDEWDDRMVALGYPAREAITTDCPSPDDYARPIGTLFEELWPQDREPPSVVFEPGRAITSAAQTLLLSAIARKPGAGARKLIFDGGKNITLPLGWETHKIFPLAGLRRPFDARTDLYGPLCHPGDVIARHLPLPPLDVGDSIAIMDAGAYFVPNQMNFSNPRPAIVAVDGGQARLVRTRESFEDIVRLDAIR